MNFTLSDENGGYVTYIRVNCLKKKKSRGAWVAQSVEHLTLDFRSGHDVTAVREIEPRTGLRAVHDSLSVPLSGVQIPKDVQGHWVQLCPSRRAN